MRGAGSAIGGWGVHRVAGGVASKSAGRFWALALMFGAGDRGEGGRQEGEGARAAARGSGTVTL